MVSATAEWIAVDWGTSNVRAWGIDATGGIAFTAASDRGMAKLSRADYPGALTDLLGSSAAAADGVGDVLICGMAGSRQGWLEAPYLETPAELSQLSGGAVRPEPVGRLTPRILPGICQRSGREDVMRGEETQLFGLLTLKPGFEGTAILPGTHSKWARIESGRVIEFSTAMTGELYDVLGAHTVLRHAVGGERDGPATEEGIGEGLEAGLAEPERLTALLFRTRAAALLSRRGADWCSGYLAGLLVGAEVAGHRKWIGSSPIPVIGSDRLNRLYVAALDRIGASAEAVDATTATLAGLGAARRQLAQ